MAFLPADGSWCKQPDPHMTLVYGGETESRVPADFNTMAKDAMTVARIMGPFTLEVTGVEVFGEPGEQVDVLTLHPTPALLGARQLVEYWDKSGFPEYKPHATIGPVGSANSFETEVNGYKRSGLPRSIYFNQIVTVWGDRRIVFNLGAEAY